MSEVWSFLDCYLYKIGTSASTAGTYSIDAYAEGVDVSCSYEKAERRDTSGLIVGLVPTGTSVQMSIKKLYSSGDRISLFDGNDLLLRHMNALGTEAWKMAKAVMTEEGYSMGGDDVAAYDIGVQGASWGTV